MRLTWANAWAARSMARTAFTVMPRSLDLGLWRDAKTRARDARNGGYRCPCYEHYELGARQPEGSVTEPEVDVLTATMSPCGIEPVASRKFNAPPESSAS